jgi:hypothetical protein
MSQNPCFVLPEIKAWAHRQWREAALGEARPTQRPVAVGAALAAATEKGLPEQMGSWAATKAAYRLLDERLEFGAVNHWTRDCCRRPLAAGSDALRAQNGYLRRSTRRQV